MKARYRKYFMRNIMSVRDDFATYYVQDSFARRDTIFGVELMRFLSHRDTVEWLFDCLAFDHCARYELRSFLSENGPRSYLLHRMDDRKVINEVARVLMDGDFPVVVRPEFEPPWRSSDTIDALCAIQAGEPLSGIAASPALIQAHELLDRAANLHKKSAGRDQAERQLRAYDIDPFDADAAQSSWDAPKWKRIYQQRLQTEQLQAHEIELIQHSAKGWDDPYTTLRVIANAFLLIAKTTDYILSNPIDALIVDPVKDFINLFEPPKANSSQEKARLDVLGKRRLSHDIDPNDLDTADYPRRVDEWESQHNNRHRNDRTPAWKNWSWPTPQDAEQILAVLITVVISKKLGKRFSAAEETASAESLSVRRQTTAKKGPGKTIETETRSIENLENPKGKSYDTEKNRGPKTTANPKTKPSKTKPTGAKGGKPSGKKTDIKGFSDLKRSLQRENESAELLANKGYKVEQNPETLPNGRNPDYKIEGEYVDCYAPKTDNIEKIRNKISKKVKNEQADRIVVNLDDCKFKPKDIADILKRKPKDGLNEVIGIKNGEVTQIFP